MEVRGDLVLFTVSIEIYTQVILSLVTQNKMIVHKQTCWLASRLHLVNMIKIDVKDQTLTTLDQHVLISTFKETLESRVVNDFFTVIEDSCRLQLYSNLINKVLRK